MDEPILTAGAQEPTEPVPTLFDSEGQPAPAPADGQTGQAPTEPAPAPAPASAPFDIGALKAPEGFELPKDHLDAFASVVGTSLSGEQAQKLVDLSCKVIGEQLAAQREASAQYFAQSVKAWNSEVQNDPVIGGAKLKENLGYANNLIQAYCKEAGDSRLADYLKDGVGAFPPMVRFLVWAGKQYRGQTEDAFVSGTRMGGARTVDDVASSMFKNSV